MDYWRHQVFCLVTHRYKKGELVENEEVQNVSDTGDFPAYDAEAIETKWQRVWEGYDVVAAAQDLLDRPPVAARRHLRNLQRLPVGF